MPLLIVVAALLGVACASPIEDSAEFIPSPTSTFELTAVAINPAEVSMSATPPATSTPIATAVVSASPTPLPPGATAEKMEPSTPIVTVATEKAIMESEPEGDEGTSVGVVVPENLKMLVAEIVEDIFGRTNTPHNKITLVSIEPITWSDGSLGCPEPDMLYTMAVVDGYRILFTADAVQMAYHTSGSHFFKYCANPPG